MHKTVLQVPMNQELKTEAEQAAREQGFSSLQEMVRVFLSKIASNNIEITLQTNVKLSEKSERRYLKETLDFEAGKNTHTAENLDEFVTSLNANKVS